jgi:hypothetical protein
MPKTLTLWNTTKMQGSLVRSVRYLTTSNNCTSDNITRMQNQRLRVQF